MVVDSCNHRVQVGVARFLGVQGIYWSMVQNDMDFMCATLLRLVLRA